MINFWVRREIESTSDDFVGALDGVRVKVLFARFGFGHEGIEATRAEQ